MMNATKAVIFRGTIKVADNLVLMSEPSKANNCLSNGSEKKPYMSLEKGINAIKIAIKIIKDLTKDDLSSRNCSKKFFFKFTASLIFY